MLRALCQAVVLLMWIGQTLHLAAHLREMGCQPREDPGNCLNFQLLHISSTLTPENSATLSNRILLYTQRKRNLHT